MNLLSLAAGKADVWYCYDDRGTSNNQYDGSNPLPSSLQWILSRYLGLDPGSILVAKDLLGKPLIIDPSSSQIEISLSHLEDRMFVAVGRGPIGVDGERERDDIRPLEMARRWFHSGEASRIVDRPRDEHIFDFYQTWTLRESYLKAIGTGFRTGKDASEIVPRRLLPGAKSHIHLGHVVLGERVHLAVAARSPIRRIRIIGFESSRASAGRHGAPSDVRSVIHSQWGIR